MAAKKVKKYIVTGGWTTTHFSTEEVLESHDHTSTWDDAATALEFALGFLPEGKAEYARIEGNTLVLNGKVEEAARYDDAHTFYVARIVAPNKAAVKALKEQANG